MFLLPLIKHNIKKINVEDIKLSIYHQSLKPQSCKRLTFTEVYIKRCIIAANAIAIFNKFVLPYFLSIINRGVNIKNSNTVNITYSFLLARPFKVLVQHLK